MAPKAAVKPTIAKKSLNSQKKPAGSGCTQSKGSGQTHTFDSELALELVRMWGLGLKSACQLQKEAQYAWNDQV